MALVVATLPATDGCTLAVPLAPRCQDETVICGGGGGGGGRGGWAVLAPHRG